MSSPRNDNIASEARLEPNNLGQNPPLAHQNPAAQAPPAQPNQQQEAAAQNPGVWIRTYLGFVPTQQNLKFLEDNKILFLSSKTEVIHPDDESFISMLSINFYPLWKLCSLTTFLIAASIIVFIVLLSLGHLSSSFLQVKKVTLYDLGMNWSRYVYQGQVYRLLTCLFLHLNIAHLWANIFIMFFLLPYFEHTFGWLKTLIVLLATGITANIFSNIISVDPGQLMIKAGANNYLFGFIGLGFGYLALNWSSLHVIGPVFKFKLFITLLLAGLFLIIFCDQAGYPDYAGHLGGFLAGFFFSGFMTTVQENTDKTIARGVFVSLFLVMCVGSFLFFYLMPQASYSF